MQSVHRMCERRYRHMRLLAPLLILCLLILAGCGYSSGNGSSGSTSNGGTQSGGIHGLPPRQVGPVRQPVGTPDSGQAGTGSAQGCPSNTVYMSDPVKADVVVKPAGSNVMVHAHVGNVIEIQLPYGKRWEGPQSNQGSLALAQPYGYGLKSANVCVWRFSAQDAGTTALQFTSRPLCKQGQMCPMYIAVLPITVAVS